MNIWLIMFCAGGVTYLTRLSFILLLESLNLSPKVEVALRYVPVAVLSAFIVPDLLIVDTKMLIGADNIRLLSGMVAIIIGLLTKNSIATISSGMLTLWFLQYLSSQ